MSLTSSISIERSRDGGLLQSPLWARFQEANEHRVLTIDDSQQAVVNEIPPLGRYLYIPRGSRVGSIDERKLAECVVREKVGWVRVEPESEEDLEQLKKNYGGRLVSAPRDIQPRELFVVSLLGTEEEWLVQMKPKTRYNIRLAEKHGVTVHFSRAAQDMEAFIGLIQSTTNRKSIRPHPPEYYRNFFQIFPEETCVLAVAEYEGKILAASLLVFFEGRAYYLHGGSSDERRELMAPFLLHFASMREAKRRDMTLYDFGGVRVHSKKNENDTDWDGITRFKLGFALHQETLLFPGTYDIIFDRMKYFLYNSLRRLRALF